VPATLTVLHDGYADDRGVASSVVLVVDAEATIVIDPGMVRDPALILGPLADAGVGPSEVTDVVISHHHPDHTWHIALFPAARLHDVWAVYRGDQWEDRPAEGFAVSANVSLIETPGHTAQDITTLVATDEGLVACTHLWWSAEGPAEDPLASDAAALAVGRARVLGLRPARIVPGHGPAFVPDDATAR
jgi:glyoxylase-like metal-dependent hydrolase (beta-lactamase superfamily II)